MRYHWLCLICMMTWAPISGLSQGNSVERGLPYLKNYLPSEYNAFSQNWDFVHDSRGFLYIANGDGVLEFDGVHWRLIRVSNRTVVRSLAIDSTDRIYVGATREIGYLAPDSIGQLSYVSLMDRMPATAKPFELVYNTVVTPTGVFFHTVNHLFRYQGDSIKVWGGYTFGRANWAMGQLFLVDANKGVFVVAGDSLHHLPELDQLSPRAISQILPYAEGEWLICMNQSPYYRYNGQRLIPLEGPLTHYLRGNRVIRAQRLPDSTYAFASYEQGLVIGDKAGNLLNLINEESGLNTNMVLGAHMDQQGGLWLGLNNGLARVEAFSPLSNFDGRNGLEGPVNDIIRHKDTLYVATGLGIYRMVHRKADMVSARFELVDPKLRVQAFYFLEKGEDLLIASGSGLFLLREGNITRVADRRCAFLYPSPYTENRVYVGLAAGIAVVEQEDGKWIDRGKLAGLDKDTRSLYESAPNRLWASLQGGDIYRIDLQDSEAHLPQATFTRFSTEHGLPQGYIHMLRMRNQFYFRRNERIFTLDEAKARFVPDSGLARMIDLPLNSFKPKFEDEAGNIWVFEVHENGAERPHVARLQPDGSYIRSYIPANRITQDVDWILYPEGDSVLWMGGSDGIVRVRLRSKEMANQPYKAFIRGIRLMGDSLIYGGEPLPGGQALQIPFTRNAMRFTYAAPSYDAMERNHFQVKLEGFDAEWSDWTEETRKDYTNLPEGQYHFRVRAKNVYDRISEADIFSFDVLPPWYRSWWAFALYTLGIFGGIWALLAWRSRRLEAEKAALEQIVHKRTAEVAEQNLKLAAQTQQLQELDLLKSRFFANISHEFRTPLTLILGPLSARLDRDESYADREMDVLMHRHASRLLRLVNQLLDLSRLESGNLQLVPEKGDLAAFFRASISAFRSLAEQLDITFETELPDQAWWVWFDRDKLEKILSNLLSNAFKFTPKGGKVQVKVRFDKAEHQYMVQVHNSGSFIPVNQREAIFGRFVQLGTQSESGTGIGLALVKELVALHPGSLKVESDPDQGTLFSIRLPTLLPAIEVESPETGLIPLDSVIEASSPAATDTPLPEVLVIEDHEDVRAYLQQGLEAQYQVRVAHHGRQGLAMAIEHVPDLIITDLMMPEMDGLTLCKKLKNDSRTSHIPIILLTAKANVESRIEGLEMGADDYLTKPFHRRELLTRMHNLIEQRRQLRQRFRQEGMVHPPEFPITSADGRFLRQLSEILEKYHGDSDFSIQIFREKMGMSKTQFHRKLTALTDQSPSELVRTYRLRRAAQLLDAQHDNVSQVAFAVGFNSLSYFAKCFKEQYGVNPSQYSATS